MILYVALLVAGGLIVQLSRQGSALAARYEVLREPLQWPHPGYSVPTFETRTLDGDPVRVGETTGEERQLVFVFRTTCPYCRASLKAWKGIASAVEAQRAKVRVLGIGLDEDEALRAYREEHGLGFAVLRFPSEKLVRLYRARSVPLVVVLDSAGQVSYSRVGVLESEAAVDSVLAAVLGDERPSD